jgi:hypothetical protein
MAIFFNLHELLGKERRQKEELPWQ